MKKMFVINKSYRHRLVLMGLCCFGSLTSLAQGKKNVQRLENKIDSVLILLQNDVVQMQSHLDTLNKDCEVETKELNQNQYQALEKVKSELFKAKEDIDKLQKEKTEYQIKLVQSNVKDKKQIENILDFIMLGGTSIGIEGINYFLELAKLYKVDNLKKMEEYTVVFKQVIQLEQEFNEMKDFEKITTLGWTMHSKTYNYRGLHQEVVALLLKLKNFCDKEQKLIDAITLSQTQTSEENRKKQLLRRDDDFNDYPYLKSEMAKAIANKEYKISPKCNQ